MSLVISLLIPTLLLASSCNLYFNSSSLNLSSIKDATRHASSITKNLALVFERYLISKRARMRRYVNTIIDWRKKKENVFILFISSSAGIILKIAQIVRDC